MSELRKDGLSDYKIRKLIIEGYREKLNKGFENTKYQGEESDFYSVKAHSSKAVVSLLSAASYYQLTTYIPDAVDIAAFRKAKISTMSSWPKMNVHYDTDSRYGLGIVKVIEGRNDFQIFDIEKTVLDMVFYRERAESRKPKKS